MLKLFLTFVVVFCMRKQLYLKFVESALFLVGGKFETAWLLFENKPFQNKTKLSK